MHILAKVTLENEMDLVLAHKRCMKLAEIAGLSLPAQTTFATAVSEVSRNTIDHGKNGCLFLGISDDKERSIIANINDDNLHDPKLQSGLDYAKRLVSRLKVHIEEDARSIRLFYHVPNSEKIGIKQLDEWRRSFSKEPPMSPYDEIKRKNEQLQEMAQKLKDSEDHYRILTDTLPLMIFSLDEDGKFIYANKWLLDYLGYSLEELNNPQRNDTIHKDDLASVDTLRALIRQGELIKTQWRVKEKRSGNYYWHLVSILPLKNGTAKPANWFGFLVDIDAQKLYEETLKDNKELKIVQAQLQENIRELNRSNQELQQFAFVASHDLQEPLRKIMFYSDFIHNKYSAVVDDRSLHYLKSMCEASVRMRSLISDLLSFSQVDKKIMDIKAIDLNQIMKQVIDDYDLKISEKNAIVVVDQLPVIEGDVIMLSRLLDNILSNALKYVREGVVPEVRVTAFQLENMVELSVSDNGIGFEEKMLSKMFTLFQRLHTREKYDGTGLGLAICSKIANMHHGFITATSKIGIGSTFTIHLPLKQPQSQPAKPLQAAM